MAWKIMIDGRPAPSVNGGEGVVATSVGFIMRYAPPIKISNSVITPTFKEAIANIHFLDYDEVPFQPTEENLLQATASGGIFGSIVDENGETHSIVCLKGE